MNPIQFAYWLQGYFEISGSEALTPEQVKIIKNHLALVFAHSIDAPDSTGELQAIHDGIPPKPTTSPPGDQIYRC